MKTKCNKKIPYVLLGSVTALGMMLVLYAFAGIYPFGTRTLASIDGISQGLVFLSEMSEKIKTGSSLFFSWHIGGGTNFWTVIAYYLVNPLNLIALLFNRENIDNAFSVIMLLKPSVLAFTFGIFLKKVYGKNDFSVTAFSVLWSFSSFVIMSLNFAESWTNSLIWLPLVVMGLHRMFEGKSALQYSLFLGLAIASNFYIGWMICIFCVLYFIYLFISDDEVVYEGVTGNAGETDNGEESVNVFKMLSNSYLLKNFFKFALSSLLAGGISAVFILPIIKALANTGKGTITNAALNFSDFHMIWGLAASLATPIKAEFSIFSSKSCIFVFAGIITLILSVSYFFNKGISVRQKAGTVFLFAVFFVSILFHTPYFIWHGFGEPVGVMYRFAFLISFILLKIAYESFINIEKTSVLGIILGVAFTGFCTAGIYFIPLFNVYSFSVQRVLTIAMFTVIYAVILLIISKKVSAKSVLTFVLLICIIGETVALNKNVISSSQIKKTLGEYSGISKYIEKVSPEERITFNTNVNEYNDILMYGGLFGYNTYESYSSMSDFAYTLTLTDFGTYGNRLNYQNGGKEQTPIFNMFFPSDYYIDGTGRLQESEYRTIVEEKDGYALFKNNFTMPFMFTVSESIKNWDPFAYPIHIDNLNEATKCLTATEDNTVFYNTPQNFVFENCKHISAFDRVETNHALLVGDQQDAHTEEHTHSDSNENDLSKYYEWLEKRMSGYSYEIEDMSKTASVTFESVAEKDGMMYLYVDTNEFTDLTVEINGKKLQYFVFGKTDATTYELGEVKKGDVAVITIGGHRDLDFGNGNVYGVKKNSFTTISFTVDMEVFKKGYEKLDSFSDTEMLEFSDTRVKAKVNSNIDGMLYIPTAFDEGWTVTVDGNEVPIYEHESHILMTEITKGEHIVEMKYCPQGFTAGAVITGASVLILIAWAVISKKRNDKMNAFDISQNNVNEE